MEIAIKEKLIYEVNVLIYNYIKEDGDFFRCKICSRAIKSVEDLKDNISKKNNPKSIVHLDNCIIGNLVKAISKDA